MVIDYLTVNRLVLAVGSTYFAYPAGSACWKALALNFIVGLVFFHKAIISPVGLTSVSA